MIADEENIEIDNILRQHRLNRDMTIRNTRRKNYLWKKRRGKMSKATQLSRSMGTKVTYYRLGNFSVITTTSGGLTNNVFNIRDQIANSNDFGNLQGLYGRIQCTSIAWRYTPSFNNIGNVFFEPLGMAYDGQVSTALTQYKSVSDYRKHIFVGEHEKNPWYAVKTEQGAYSIQDLDTFSAATNILGYIKMYSQGGTANTQRGYLEMQFNCYLYDRK